MKKHHDAFLFVSLMIDLSYIPNVIYNSMNVKRLCKCCLITYELGKSKGKSSINWSAGTHYIGILFCTVIIILIMLALLRKYLT